MDKKQKNTNITKDKNNSEVAGPDDKIRTVILQTVLEMLSYLGVRARVDVKKQERGYYANIKTNQQAGLLIGKSGANLKAIQHIIWLIVQKRAGYSVPLIVDVAGYRMRRVNFLKKKALAIAKIVLETKREMALDQLTDREVEVVGETLSQIAGVRFYTIKAGNKKNVIVSLQQTK